MADDYTKAVDRKRIGGGEVHVGLLLSPAADNEVGGVDVGARRLESLQDDVAAREFEGAALDVVHNVVGQKHGNALEGRDCGIGYRGRGCQLAGAGVGAGCGVMEARVAVPSPS